MDSNGVVSKQQLHNALVLDSSLLHGDQLEAPAIIGQVVVGQLVALGDVQRQPATSWRTDSGHTHLTTHMQGTNVL